VIDTGALLGYEAIAGVHFGQGDGPTSHFDFGNAGRTRLTLGAREKVQPSHLIGVLKAVDKSFEFIAARGAWP